MTDVIRVRIPAALRDYAGGRAVVELEGTTARDVLAALERRHPAVGRRVLDEQGIVRRHVHVWIGEELLRSLDEAIPSGVEITILPAVSGGH